ncbi:MAG: hypothetical protein M3O86_06090 [Actinomycetota bacterium]|nr:hypothetical protein [Actinomycetota bacterium]
MATLLERVAAAATRDPQRVEPVLHAILGETPRVSPTLRTVADRVNAARRAAALDEFRDGALTTRQAVARLPAVTTAQGVHRLGKTGRLLRRTIGNATYWPSWQFADAGLRDDLDRLLAVLRGYVGDDALAADRVMRLPRPQLGGRSVAEVLDDDDRDTAWGVLATLGAGF